MDTETTTPAGARRSASEGTIAPEVRPVGPADKAAWRACVLDHPDGTPFHLPAWSDGVERAYGHVAEHLAAWRGERMVGVLPLMRVKSVFVGKVLVSVPYGTYGGILADDADASKALLAAAEARSREIGAQYIELRHREPSGLDLVDVGHYDTFRRELPGDPDDLMAWLPRKTRTAVRKGLKTLGDDAVAVGPERLGEVYDLYAITLRRLGSPNYRRRLFTALAETFGDDCVSLVVRDGGEAVSGVISFLFRDEIVPYFSGSNDRGMQLRSNNLMYISLMDWAIRRGIRIFDFNRTRRDNKGPYDFKRHHGFEPAPLHYQVSLNRASEPPNLSPSSGKFALAIRTWKKLPLWFTRRAGAVVTKWIP